jgi:hypothetical protein
MAKPIEIPNTDIEILKEDSVNLRRDLDLIKSQFEDLIKIMKQMGFLEHHNSNQVG